MSGTELKQLEALLKKSTDEQQKGVIAITQAAFARKDTTVLEKIAQYGSFSIFLYYLTT